MRFKKYEPKFDERAYWKRKGLSDVLSGLSGVFAGPGFLIACVAFVASQSEEALPEPVLHLARAFYAWATGSDGEAGVFAWYMKLGALFFAAGVALLLLSHALKPKQPGIGE